MKERRNLYRILHVQPDAPLTVIEANHRALMQRLRLHPDQGFADLLAGQINAAYVVLQDPLKRAVYDCQLQKRYPIRKLSLGSFATGAVRSVAGRTARRTNDNRRNYYRILQVQPDAPVAVIIASYHALMKYPFQNSDLLDEAFAVLANPAVRLRYDAFLAGISALPSQDLIPVNQGNDYKAVTGNAVLSSASNSPTAMRYCVFCHTPYTKQLNPYQDDECLACASPLPGPVHEQFTQKNRATVRIGIRGAFKFYLFWPDTPCEGMLQDLSPSGARFLTNVLLEPLDIIKIDAPNFRAVAEVLHQQCGASHVSIGVRFLTIKFERERGNFFAANA